MSRKRVRPGPGAPILNANVAELRALAHPLRLRMMELFAERPRTTKQVADLLGEPPTRLYHHVAALERSGLLVLRETRKNRGTVEKWYEAVTQTLGGGVAAGRGKAAAGARRAVATTVLDQSRKEIDTAIAQPGAEPPLIARVVMSAPPAMIPEIRQRLYVFLKDLKQEYTGDTIAVVEACERWAMTLTFAPATPPRGASERRRDAEENG
jgi:DNA-binding transcriptional ArsR family regulator